MPIFVRVCVFQNQQTQQGTHTHYSFTIHSFTHITNLFDHPERHLFSFRASLNFTKVKKKKENVNIIYSIHNKASMMMMMMMIPSEWTTFIRLIIHSFIHFISDKFQIQDQTSIWKVYMIQQLHQQSASNERIRIFIFYFLLPFDWHETVVDLFFPNPSIHIHQKVKVFSISLSLILYNHLLWIQLTERWIIYQFYNTVYMIYDNDSWFFSWQKKTHFLVLSEFKIYSLIYIWLAN